MCSGAPETLAGVKLPKSLWSVNSSSSTLWLLGALVPDHLLPHRARARRGGPTTLVNGEAQTAWLASASYAYFAVTLPSAALQLNLALTSLAGGVGLFASTTWEPQVDAQRSLSVSGALDIGTLYSCVH